MVKHGVNAADKHGKIVGDHTRHHHGNERELRAEGQRVNVDIKELEEMLQDEFTNIIY